MNTIRIVTLALPIALLSLACSGPTYRFQGMRTIETTASQGVISEAIRMTHNDLGLFIRTEDGKNSDSSFSQSSRWSDSSSGQRLSTRSRTEFVAEDGTRYEIETIEVVDRPTLILLDASSEESARRLANTLSRLLSESGVEAGN